MNHGRLNFKVMNLVQEMKSKNFEWRPKKSHKSKYEKRKTEQPL